MERDSPGAGSTGAGSVESERIAFLLKRDGFEATRAWVERTLGIYRQALAQPGGMATDPQYRREFERSVQEFEQWLATHPGG